MVSLNVTIDTSGLNLMGKLENLPRNLTNNLSTDVKKTMQKNTPKDKGTAKSNWTINQTSDTIHEVVNNTRYLPWVNDGTGLYGPRHRRITPRHARVLHFTWKGKEWFLKSVRGQKGQKFVEKSMNETKNRINNIVVKTLNETIRG